MITAFKEFSFRAPPRTGRGWFIAAAEKAGLRVVEERRIAKDLDEFIVSVVRHPYTWLWSLYHNTPRCRYYTSTHLNQLVHYASLAPTFCAFLHTVTEVSGHVGRVFDGYTASTVIRLEDFPYSAIQIFESFGSVDWSMVSHHPVNKGAVEEDLTLEINKKLRRLVVESEREYCERYDYY